MAQLVIHLAVGIRSSDLPVSSGLVYSYATGTTTPQGNLYTTPAGADAADVGALHSNPATLDVDGKLEAYCADNANFRLRVRNAADTSTIDDWDPAISSGGSTLADFTVGSDNTNAFTAGANETADDALNFIWKCFSNNATSATAKDMKVLHTGTGAVGRYLYQQVSDEWNIKDFGAVGDDSTDNQAFIIAAIDACATAGGGRVRVPGGVFRVGGTLDLTNQDNVSIIGDGPGSIIKATFTNAAIITVTGTSDGTEIASLQLQGAGGSGTTTALGISVASTVGDTAGEIPVNVHDVVFSGPSDGTGLNVGVECLGQRGNVTNCYFQRLYGTNSCGVRLNTGSDWRVQGNHMLMVDAASGRAQYGVANPAGTGGGGSVITGNFIEGCSLAGIYLSTVTGANIQGNRVEGGSSHGINVVGSSDFSVFGNTVNGTGGAGIAIGTDCSGFTVSGNSSQSNTTHGISIAQSADSAASVPRNGIVMGNNCRSNTQNGINLTGTDKVCVMGNTITDNGSNGSYAGIEVTTALPVATHRGGNNNSIIGNMVTDTTGTVHSVPLRIQRSGGGGAITDAGNTALVTTAVMDNRLQSAGGTTVYTFGVTGYAPPNFVGNVAAGRIKGRTSLTASATLLASQSGQIVDNAGAGASVTMTLPDLLSDQYNVGLEFWISRQSAFDVVIAANTGDTIFRRDATSGSITLSGTTDQHVHIWSVGIEWRCDVVDYTT